MYEHLITVFGNVCSQNFIQKRLLNTGYFVDVDTNNWLTANGLPFTAAATSLISQAHLSIILTSAVSPSSSFSLILFTCCRRRSQYNLSSDIFVFSASVFSWSSVIVTASMPTNSVTVFYSGVQAMEARQDFTLFSLCSVICKASFGCSKCHQPFLPLSCIDGSEVKVLLSWYG